MNQNHCSNPVRRRRDLAFAAAVTLAGLAGASAMASGPWAADAVDLTVARSGETVFRAGVHKVAGDESLLSDSRAPGRTVNVRSESHGSLVTFRVSSTRDDLTSAAGDLVRVTLTGIPGGYIPSSLTVTAADGSPIGRAEALGEGIYVSWFAGEAARRGGEVAIQYAMAGAPVLPQPRMGDPLDGLDSDQLMRWTDGRVDYNTPLPVELGLGPIFNKENCGNCHNVPTGGTGTQTVTLFGFSGKSGFDPLEEFGGPLLQAGALDIACIEAPPAFANVSEKRVTNGMLGYGLVEALLDSDIMANESSGPGVSGWAHITEAKEAPGIDRVGRFGWKAQLPTVLSFSADASRNEMGLSNRLIPTDPDPNGDQAPGLELCDTMPDPEDFPDENGRAFIDRVTDFQRFLAAPPQTPKSGMTGEDIFNTIGCVQCHVRDFATPNDLSLEEAIRGQAIRPYSDFLLHDMGLNGDAIPTGQAGERETRTPPLWGVRIRPALWHDGRFVGDYDIRMTAAILAHESPLSEGTASAQAFEALSQDDKDALLAFLDSLGRAEFDANGDNFVTLPDFVDFAANFGSSGVTPDDMAAVHDIDQDGDIDSDDFAAFLSVYDGPFEDCNGNGLIDIRDIIEGTLPDENGDGIVDDCTAACPGDLDNDGMVGFTDIIEVLSFFGQSDPAGGDADLDGDVDFDDLILVLSVFGPCA